MPYTSSSNRREAIFARFDRLTSYSLIWISAPAGYGKTTAVSSYLRERHRPCVSYQCDDGDADIASFFGLFVISCGQKWRHPSAEVSILTA